MEAHQSQPPEKPTIFGLTRDEVKKVLLSWPELNEAGESVCASNQQLIQQSLGLPDAKQARAVAEVHFGQRNRACADFRQVERQNPTRFL